MRLSSLTTSILKNFSSINSYLLIEPGQILHTSSAGGVLAHAKVEEEFPTQVVIYDLGNFLSVAGLFHQPNFEFEGDLVRLTGQDGEAEVQYLYAPLSLVHRPLRIPNLPLRVIEFELPEPGWSAILNAASLLNKSEVRIFSDGDRVEMMTYDHKNPRTHTFSMPVDAKPNGLRCDHRLNIGNLKLLKASYRVSVSSRFTMFEHTNAELKYWVACDPSSTFGEADYE